MQSKNLEIFNRVVKKRDEEEKEESTPDPFEAIAELMFNLQNRIEKLEKEGKRLNEELIDLRSKKESRLINKVRKISFIRDSKTHQIISSIITEEDESDA